MSHTCSLIVNEEKEKNIPLQGYLVYKDWKEHEEKEGRYHHRRNSIAIRFGKPEVIDKWTIITSAASYNGSELVYYY